MINMIEQIKGIIPPMTTPFHKDGSIDEETFSADVDYLLQAGVHGLAVGGSTGEGHTLSVEELVQLNKRAVLQASGKIPIIAGIIADSTREVIARGEALADVGVTALQITPVHYLFTPDERAMYDYYAQISDAVGLPIIIYNVIPWSYCSPELLASMIREIDRVIGVKQSAGDMHSLAELLMLLGQDGAVLAAVDDLLYSCFTLGAHGSIAAILTAVPETCIALWNAVQYGNHDKALGLHQELFELWLVLSGSNLPARVKVAMRLQKRASGLSRSPMPMPTEAEEKQIKSALEKMKR